MGTEIERKYLVRRLPDSLASCSRASIRQGYLIATDNGLELRVRQKEQRYLQTIKAGEGLSRTEIEIELSEAQFNELWKYTAGRRVSKSRYRVPIGEHVAELDIYEGDLSGLQLVEVEFSSVAASRQFMPPDWFGAEVTDDRRYKNKHLAIHGLPEIEGAK